MSELPEDEPEEDNLCPELQEAAHEANAAMVRARQKVAEVKKLRGYFTGTKGDSAAREAKEKRIAEMQK
eukprot:19355-Lingulodinium_polyedra.AAC.1